MSFKIELGGVSVEINHRYEYIKKLCRDYMTDREAAFSVSVTDEQIKEERKATDKSFPLSVCESTCIHREISNRLVSYGVFLMHSAVVAVDGTAYVFMAKSGVGKSTHIRLWQECYGERAVVVNGDKPMFSFKDDVLYAHGSPWRGKEQLGEPISMPVGGICFLERNENNIIDPATSEDIVNKLFHQVLLPKNSEDIEMFMDFISRMAATIPFYKLKCNMCPDAARVSYEGMRGDRKR